MTITHVPTTKTFFVSKKIMLKSVDACPTFSLFTETSTTDNLQHDNLSDRVKEKKYLSQCE